MKMAFFTVPVHDDGKARDALNVFLSTHPLREIERRFVDSGPNSFWAISISFDDHRADRPSRQGERKVDYREVLPAAEFAVFSRLRQRRKELALTAGLPPYQVATDRQLAAMIQRRVTSLPDLARVEGMGPARLEHFGEGLVEVLREMIPKLQIEKDDAAPSGQD